MEEAAQRLSVSAKETEAVLAKLQSLEPAGIGARSLQECILLQLQRLPNRNEHAEMLVSAHFDAFAQKSGKRFQWRLEFRLIPFRISQMI